ncbi:hypothetical protein [Amycolatopsis sp. NPDC054798]
MRILPRHAAALDVPRRRARVTGTDAFLAHWDRLLTEAVPVAEGA